MSRHEERGGAGDSNFWYIHGQLSSTPDSVKILEGDYHAKKRAQHQDLAQFTEAIGTVISRVNDTNPHVLIGAVTLARKLSLWELEPEVRVLNESQSEAISFSSEREQVKRETEIFLGFKRYHAHLEREKELVEKPYHIPPPVFQEVIKNLDLDFTEEE